MTTYIDYQLDENTTIRVESTEDPASGLVQAAAGDTGPVVKKADQTFREAFQNVKAQAKFLLDEFESLPASELEFKFGVSVDTEGNFVVGKIAVGVNYEITMKWKRAEEKK